MNLYAHIAGEVHTHHNFWETLGFEFLVVLLVTLAAMLFYRYFKARS